VLQYFAVLCVRDGKIFLLSTGSIQPASEKNNSLELLLSYPPSLPPSNEDNNFFFVASDAKFSKRHIDSASEKAFLGFFWRFVWLLNCLQKGI